MGFHEISFPLEAGVGSDVGPGFDTAVHVGDGKFERRIQRASQAQHQINVSVSVRGHADLTTLKAFYLRVNGVLDGFRLLDIFDYTSNAFGRTWGDDYVPASHDPTDVDQVLGAGDGSTVQFQLIKVYGSSDPTYTRTIQKPIAGTVVCALDGVTKTEGVDYTVDHTTGIVTWNSAPGLGVVVTAGFEFEVPMRFGVEIDRVLRQIADTGGSSSASAIPMIELLHPSPHSQRIHAGGATAWGSIAADRQLSVGDGLVQSMTPSTSGLVLTLPAVASLEPGGPYLVLVNESASNSMSAMDQETGLVSFTLGTSSATTFYLGLDSSSNKKWYAVT